MTLKRCYPFLVFYFLLTIINQVASEKYKFCVVDGRGGFKRSSQYCPLLDHPDSKVQCVVGIDRYDCLRKMSKGVADFSVLTPEDLVAAANSEIELLVTNELRITDDTYEYEVVAVVNNGAGITDRHTLRDKRFCHPGYGYETDWTRILSNYLETSVVPQKCNPQLTLTENRIKASSDFFKSACKAGPWVNSPTIDQELKMKYPNLCAACDTPYKCSKEDKYWGRRGSLFCLSDGAGDISWARLDDVKVHFGLMPGGAETTPEDFSYLCPDGTTKPLNTTSPCVWLVKPWSVIATKRTSAQDVQKLMSNLAYQDTDSWRSALISLIESYHLSIKSLNPIEPIEDYLDRATGFLSANSFTGCHPPRTIRLCTTSIIENSKCAWLREAAAVYGIEPDLDCLKADNTTHCMKALETDNADVVMVPPDLVHTAVKEYHLETLLYEVVREEDQYATVAIVKSNSGSDVTGNLKGFKACFPSYDGVAWNSAKYSLNKMKLLDSCPIEEGMKNFFSGICASGLPSNFYAEPSGSSCDSSFFGDYGALRCLLQNSGNVAFISRNSLDKFIAEVSRDKTTNITKNDFKVLCPKTSRTCTFGWSTVGQIMIRQNSSPMWMKDTSDVFLQLDQLFGRNYRSLTVPFTLFGSFNGKSNVLFHDETIILRNQPVLKEPSAELMAEFYDNIIRDQKCDTSAASYHYKTFLTIIIFSLFTIFI